MMVSIPHKELERKVEKSRDMKLVEMQPAINNKIELPALEYNIPDQSVWSVLVEIN